MDIETLIADALTVLATADASEKARRAVAAAERAMAAGPAVIMARAPSATPAPPDRPARPPRPPLVPPRDVPRRSPRSKEGRAALLHALAHIELNAIDLAFDMVARFAPAAETRNLIGAEHIGLFVSNWLTVGGDEGRHFLMLEAELARFDAAYGDFPAHDGLWQAAADTAHDLLARLAVVPMVLEARGLDVTPGLIDAMRAAGNEAAARALTVIYTDEIAHVAAGTRWFIHATARAAATGPETFHALVRRHFRGGLKPPFNSAARAAAGLTPDYYEPLAAPTGTKRG